MASVNPRKPATPGAALRYIGPHTGTDPIEVTLVLRRRPGAKPAAAAWPRARAWNRADFASHCGADPSDLERLRTFAGGAHLTETGADLGRRVLRLRGSPADLQRAFGITLAAYALGDGRVCVGCDAAPQLPEGVIAVLGLDARPVARPHFRRPRATPSATYTPLELGELYQFPAGTDGTGESIAIIELGGGFSASDLAQYFKGLGLKGTPAVTAVGVAGGSSQPGGDADGEVMLDIEVIGALAPAAKIAVYFAPNTDQGFYEAISQAAHDAVRKPGVMSISWGGPEDSWTAASRTAMNSALEDAAALGVTVTVACGDSGSSDGESTSGPHVDFPASSPFALACGGTKLTARDGVISAEVVWDETQAGEGATGGGVSVEFGLPDWQNNAGVPAGLQGKPGRGLPDVAGDADPLTGYEVLVDGKAQVIGGTSAVAPLWAALIARCNQNLGSPLGDVHAALYQLPAGAFRDITSGNNGTYTAGPGWDACTGLGSPRGEALVAALAALKA